MSVDDRDNGPDKEKSGESAPGTDSVASKEIRDALQSKTDEPLPPVAEAIAERDAEPLGAGDLFVVEQAPPDLAIEIAHVVGQLERASEIETPHEHVTVGFGLDEKIARIRIGVEQTVREWRAPRELVDRGGGLRARGGSGLLAI